MGVSPCIGPSTALAGTVIGEPSFVKHASVTILVIGILLVTYLPPADIHRVSAQTADVFWERNTLQLNAGENYARVGIIDADSGYAYWGTYTNPGRVVRISLSNFTESGSLTLNPDEIAPSCAVIDSAAGFAYFGTYTAPGIIVKVRLSNLTRVGSLTLGTGTDYLTTAAIDTIHGFAYFGTGTSPTLTSTGIIVKIRLSNFTVVSSLTLKSGENGLAAATIDAAGGYAYFGMNYPSHGIVRVRLSDFSENGNLTTIWGIISAVIDQAKGYALFGTNISPHGYLVKIRLSDFTYQGFSNMGYGEASSAIIDPEGGAVYFGTTLSVNSSGFVEKIDLNTYIQTATLTLNYGEFGLFSGVIDNLHGYAYFGTESRPGMIVKIQVAESPAAPTGLTAVPAAGKVKLSWSAPQSNGRAITGYRVYRGIAPGAETLLTGLGDQLSFDDTSVVNGTTYYYRVSAINSLGEGPHSNESSANPSPPLAALPLLPASLVLLAVLVIVMRWLNWRRTNRGSGP